MTRSPFVLLRHQRRVQSGFTLIEMITVIIIMAIIVALAAPSVREHMARASIIRSAGDIESAFKDARANALIRKSNVTVTFDGIARTVSVADGATILNTVTIPNNIDITSIGNMPASVTFTHLKTVIGNGNALSSTTGIGVCYQGVSSSMRVVRVDAMANISTVIDSGGCP